jgi:hypothetical protein
MKEYLVCGSSGLSWLMKMDKLRVSLHLGKEKSGNLKVTKKEIQNA